MEDSEILNVLTRESSMPDPDFKRRLYSQLKKENEAQKNPLISFLINFKAGWALAFVFTFLFVVGILATPILNSNTQNLSKEQLFQKVANSNPPTLLTQTSKLDTLVKPENIIENQGFLKDDNIASIKQLAVNNNSVFKYKETISTILTGPKNFECKLVNDVSRVVADESFDPATNKYLLKIESFTVSNKLLSSYLKIGDDVFTFDNIDSEPQSNLFDKPEVLSYPVSYQAPISYSQQNLTNFDNLDVDSSNSDVYKLNLTTSDLCNGNKVIQQIFVRKDTFKILKQFVYMNEVADTNLIYSVENTDSVKEVGDLYGVFRQ